jgi:hypothetical protein
MSDRPEDPMRLWVGTWKPAAAAHPDVRVAKKARADDERLRVPIIPEPGSARVQEDPGEP